MEVQRTMMHADKAIWNSEGEGCEMKWGGGVRNGEKMKGGEDRAQDLSSSRL